MWSSKRWITFRGGWSIERTTIIDSRHKAGYEQAKTRGLLMIHSVYLSLLWYKADTIRNQSASSEVIHEVYKNRLIFNQVRPHVVYSLLYALRSNKSEQLFLWITTVISLDPPSSIVCALIRIRLAVLIPLGDQWPRSGPVEFGMWVSCLELKNRTAKWFQAMYMLRYWIVMRSQR
jgi:hypothetical protein